MSAAPAATDAGAPPAKGKKKLILILAIVGVLLAGGGVGAVVLLKKKPVDSEEEQAQDTHAPKASSAKARDPKQAPTFVPLDPFTVNLADKTADRYAQVGLTLELGDAAAGESLKAFMPAVRNNILLVLSNKTASEMMDREGKARLAAEIQRETSRAMGVEVEDEDEGDGEDESPRKKKKKKRAAPELPVTAVYFSTFIVQ